MYGPLQGVEALLFDVFGTMVDWKTCVTEEVRNRIKDAKVTGVSDADVDSFVLEWRHGYLTLCKDIAGGAEGHSNVDKMHRQILEEMLSTTRWEALGSAWSQEVRDDLNEAWHRLKGWPDSVEGLTIMKEKTIVAALSNGNIRLLVDMAKHAKLPWDVVFSAELFNSYKPNSQVYLGAAQHLSLPPSKCAMVATHVWDLRGAAAAGLKTIYVRRPDEGIRDHLDEEVKTKEEGGEVDIVVDDLVALAKIVAAPA